MTTDKHRGRLLASVLAIVAIVALCIWQQWRLWPLFAEDAFIALRYAENLAHGHGLQWNPGEPVEGYSILLWILGCAALIAVGLDPVVASRGLGAVCLLATCVLLLRHYAPRRFRDLSAVAIAPCAVVVSATTATWVLAGLEGPLVVLLVVCGTLATIRLLERSTAPTAPALVWPGLLFGLLCLTRSDGPIWLVAPALAVGLRCHTWRARFASVGVLVLPAALMIAAQLVFRLAYYSDWLPNTAYLKVDPSWSTAREGFSYIQSAFWAARGIAPLAALGVVVGFVSHERRLRTLVLVLPVLLWSAYLVVIGGDYFPSHRLFIAVIPMLALLAAEAIGWLSRWRAGVVVASLLTIASIVVLARDSVADRSTAALRDGGIEWKNVALGRTLGTVFSAEQPLVAVDAAGGIPFASKLPTVDMLGFNDRVIAKTPVAPFVYEAVRTVLKRDYMPGHMHGNGSYVMDRTPDLVMFTSAPCTMLPMFASGYELQVEQRWLDGYRSVQMQCPPEQLPNGLTVAMRVSMWLRLEGRIGIRRAPDRIEIPGYLLGSYRQPQPFQILHPPPAGTPQRAAFDADVGAAMLWSQTTPIVAVPAGGHLEGEIVSHDAGMCSELLLPAGRWRIEIEPPTRGILVEVQSVGDGGGALLGSSAEGKFEQVRDAKVTVVTRAEGTVDLPVRLRCVRLVRQ